MTFQFTNNTVVFLLTYVKYVIIIKLIISRWIIMLWNKAVFCLEVVIYKYLQLWRHNEVIGCNEYLISTWSESTVP